MLPASALKFADLVSRTQSRPLLLFFFSLFAFSPLLNLLRRSTYQSGNVVLPPRAPLMQFLKVYEPPLVPSLRLLRVFKSSR